MELSGVAQPYAFEIQPIGLAHARERGVLFPHDWSLLFDRHELDGLVSDVFRANFELLDQLPGGAGVSETVFHTDGAGDHEYTVELPALGQNPTDPPC